MRLKARRGSEQYEAMNWESDVEKNQVRFEFLCFVNLLTAIKAACGGRLFVGGGLSSPCSC